jgi:hypothetical protein
MQASFRRRYSNDSEKPEYFGIGRRCVEFKMTLENLGNLIADRKYGI